MRRTALVALLATTAAVLAGCTPTTEVVAGSEVRVAVAAPLTSLNASTSYGRTSTTNADVAYLTGTGFGYLGDDYALVEDTSFGTAEIVAEDPLTVEYTVSDQARWSDGIPVTAADLLLAWAANSGALNTPDFDDADYVDPATGRYAKEFPDDVVSFDGAIGAGLEHAREIPEIGDDGLSLTVRFDRFVPSWRTLLAPGLPAHIVTAAALGGDSGAGSPSTETGDAAPADPDPAAAEEQTDALVAAIDDGDTAALSAIANRWNTAYAIPADGLGDDLSLLVAAGPYVVAGVADDGAITLVANPQYRGMREPVYETITLRVASDPLEAVRLLADGEVDIATPSPSAEVAEALLDVDDVTVSAGSDGTFEHLDLQFAGSKSGVFADPLVRQAFLHVVPREQIVDELVRPIQADATVLDSYTIRPGAEGFDATVEENGSDAYRETDVAAARALLAEAGVTAPQVCILYDPANPRRADEFALIQTSAARAGFEVTDCSRSDWSGMLGVAGTYDAALFAWDTTRLGADAAAAVFRSDQALANFSRYRNAEVDSLVDAVAATDDPADQATLLAEIDARLFADAYGLPLFAHPTLTAVSAAVEGVTRSPLARGVLWNAWDWRPRVD